MSKKENDPDYRPNEWIPVLDAGTLDDKILLETKDRLKSQGVKVATKRRKDGKVTLCRYGGWRQ